MVGSQRRLSDRQAAPEQWLGLGKPITRRALPWLSVTIGLGLLFLAGQWTAWHQLAVENVFFRTNQSSHFFYLITGVHAVHLFLGISALIAAFIALKPGCAAA